MTLTVTPQQYTKLREQLDINPRRGTAVIWEWLQSMGLDPTDHMHKETKIHVVCTVSFGERKEEQTA